METLFNVLMQWLLAHPDQYMHVEFYFLDFELVVACLIFAFQIWLVLAFLRVLDLTALTAEWSYSRRHGQVTDSSALYNEIHASVHGTSWLFRKTFGRYFILRLDRALGIRPN